MHASLRRWGHSAVRREVHLLPPAPPCPGCALAPAAPADHEGPSLPCQGPGPACAWGRSHGHSPAWSTERGQAARAQGGLGAWGSGTCRDLRGVSWPVRVAGSGRLQPVPRDRCRGRGASHLAGTPMVTTAPSERQGGGRPWLHGASCSESCPASQWPPSRPCERPPAARCRSARVPGAGGLAGAPSNRAGRRSRFTGRPDARPRSSASPLLRLRPGHTRRVEDAHCHACRAAGRVRSVSSRLHARAGAGRLPTDCGLRAESFRAPVLVSGAPRTPSPGPPQSGGPSARGQTRGRGLRASSDPWTFLRAHGDTPTLTRVHAHTHTHVHAHTHTPIPQLQHPYPPPLPRPHARAHTPSHATPQPSLPHIPHTHPPRSHSHSHADNKGYCLSLRWVFPSFPQTFPFTSCPWEREFLNPSGVSH